MLRLKIVEKKPLTLKTTCNFPPVILANLQDKIVTPSEEKQIIVADEGFDGLGQVTVEAMTPPKYAPRFVSFSRYRGTDLDYEISLLDTSKIENMEYCFSYLTNVTKLDLSSLDVSNVKQISYLFASSTKLTFLDVRNFTFSETTSSNSVFHNVPTNCLIIVKDEVEKEWVLSKKSTFTNIKTVAELEEDLS